MQRIVKPSNQRVKRALEKRAPKIIENTKQAMFIKGGHTSEIVTLALKELYSYRKPNAVLFKKKNITRPFEDQTSMEFFSKKSDSSLFMFGSHSKKRPHNLIIGRLFDYHVLDMVELGVENAVSMKEFQTGKISLGSKPCLLFAGEPFETDHEHQRLKNLLIDFFRGPVVDNIRLQGLEYVMMFTAIDGKILLRIYKILLKKSGTKTPRIELEEIGPSFDFVMRRTKLASLDLFKRAKRVPTTVQPKKKKNISHDVFGTKLGRIHMQSQDINKLQTRKMKGLKRKTTSKKNDSSLSKKSKSEVS
ncbi:ribosome production factor 2 homolog [Tubulanus polymorphus]|uniref:ribosome production factor 2 homolog n=1 Tax=Tubulanus polymorphus TaxID=672921 RepID=UPI003DA515AC